VDLVPVHLVVGALAAGIAHAASTPAVPVPVQQAIARRTPGLAYVPARIAIGYRYARWRFSGGSAPALRIWFRNRAGRELVFVAAPQRGLCAGGREKTFQLAGNRVYWGQTSNEQQAWRCVNRVRLVAATSQPPTAFADVGLGTIAASGHRIR
jgi:hypothetical protein